MSGLRGSGNSVRMVANFVIAFTMFAGMGTGMGMVLPGCHIQSHRTFWNRDFTCKGFLARTYMKLPDLVHALIATKNILLNPSSIFP